MALTKGQKLRQDLNIPKDCTAFISYVYRSTPNIFIVFYNTQRKNMYITKTWLSRYSNLSYYKNNVGELDISPLITLDTYNGTIGTVIAYDIAYSQLSVKESLEPTAILSQGKLHEITLADLKDKGNIAPSTMTWRQDRNKIMGSENTTLKLLDCFLNQADDSVTFAFQTTATEYKDVKDLNHDPSVYKNPKKRVSPLKLNLMNNPEKKYEIQLKILKFFSWLDTHPVGQKFSMADLKELLQVADIQIFNTSPGFHWQGINWWASQIDASAYPTDIKPKVWDKRLGGEFFVDKHTYGFLQQIKFFLNPMTSMLTSKLKQRNLI